VPSGLFQSTRVGKSRKTDSSHRAGSDQSKPAMTSTVTRHYAPFPPTYSTSQPRRSKSPSSPSSPKFYTPYQSLAYGNGTSCYPEAELLQFPVHSAPLTQRPLPQTHSSHPSPLDTQDRSVPQSTQQYPDFGRNDTYGRHQSLGSVHSQANPSFRSSSQSSGEESKPSVSVSAPVLPFSSVLHSPLDLHETPTNPLYSATQSNVGSVVNSLSSTPWYAYAPTLEPCSDHHPATFSVHNDVSANFPLRSPFPTLLEPGQSASTPTHSDTLSFTSHHVDHPHVHSNSYPHARSPEQHDRSPSSGSPTSILSLPHTDTSYIPSFESHTVEWCGFESDSRRGSLGPTRVDLAPLHALQRSHPYRRDPVDDRALRLLGPRPS
jgi:Gti1/Pac2 family transcription factor